MKRAVRAAAFTTNQPSGLDGALAAYQVDRPTCSDPLTEGASLFCGRFQAIDVGALEQHQTSRLM